MSEIQYKIVDGIEIPLTEEEITILQAQDIEWIAGQNDRDLAVLRDTRDKLLTASDWTQLPDSPCDNKEDWATYRQALRDLPDTYATNAAEAIWPTEPTQE